MKKLKQKIHKEFGVEELTLKELKQVTNVNPEISFDELNELRDLDLTIEATK